MNRAWAGTPSPPLIFNLDIAEENISGWEGFKVRAGFAWR